MGMQYKIEICRSARGKVVSTAWLHGRFELTQMNKKSLPNIFIKKDILSSEDSFSKDMETEK